MTPTLERFINALGYSRAFHLDFETYSECDIKNGIRAYASHPSTEITLAAYAYDNDEPDLYDIANDSDPRNHSHVAEIIKACNDPDVILIAWNAPFEREILRHVWGIETPAEKWLDAMVVAFAMSLPGALAGASTVLQLDDEHAKQGTGKKLIQLFCKPRPKGQKIRRRNWSTDPEKWTQFGEYCRRDVIAERKCLNRMAAFLPPPDEIRTWWHDQNMNARGMPIDGELVDAAIEVADDLKTALKRECSILTGLVNPNSAAQFLPWVQAEGYPFDSLKKDKVELALRDDGLTPIARKALALRAQFGRTSTSKYPKINAQTVDGRLCYTLQYNGAGRTCRWAGRGAQYQNLPRPPGELGTPGALALAVRAIKARDAEFLRELYDKPMDVVAGCIRPTLRAPAGKILRVADYNAIENRVLGWLARCDAILDVFRNGLDPYKDFGTRMYGVPYNEITKAQRTNSKPAVLGAGYMLGGGRLMPVRKHGKKTGEMIKTGLWAYSEALGVNLSQEESARAVQIFREAYPEVVQFWYAVDDAVRKTIGAKGEYIPERVHHGASETQFTPGHVAGEVRRSKKPVRIPVGYSGQFIEFGYVKPAMYIKLPSGRCIWYVRPRVEMCNMPWEDENGKPARAMGVTYEGMNQTTRQWCRQSTHPGKLVENITQAAARDIMAAGFVNAENAGFSTVLLVHDELVAVEDIDDDAHSVEALERVLCELPEWAKCMPMRAEGYESPFYMKD